MRRSSVLRLTLLGLIAVAVLVVPSASGAGDVRPCPQDGAAVSCPPPCYATMVCPEPCLPVDGCPPEPCYPAASCPPDPCTIVAGPPCEPPPDPCATIGCPPPLPDPCQVTTLCEPPQPPCTTPDCIRDLAQRLCEKLHLCTVCPMDHLCPPPCLQTASYCPPPCYVAIAEAASTMVCSPIPCPPGFICVETRD